MFLMKLLTGRRYFNNFIGIWADMVIKQIAIVFDGYNNKTCIKRQEQQR